MYFDSNQLLASLFPIFIAFAAGSALVFQKGRARLPVRQVAQWVITLCAILSVWAWLRFGDMHAVFVDAPDVTQGAPGRKKVEVHLPFHFHEFFHYYIGAKYFRELGYLGLYDCTAFADGEVATEEGVRPRVGGYVRDLDDVLTDKTYAEANDHCLKDFRPHFTDKRWAQFKGDIRELQKLVPDEWWGGVTFDAGFNPPPSWILVGGTLANLIPIRGFGLYTFLVSTSFDVVLLLISLLALRWAFGNIAAATAALFFGASFIASYGWNGGAYLRYTWITSLIIGLCAMRRGRWALAGAFMAASACDRIFPLGFTIGAVLPIALRAIHSLDDRKRLVRFSAGFAGTGAGLVVLSTIFLGFASWQIFFERILHHSDVYYTMHIGLKKVLTFREWVPRQNFNGHAGLGVFRSWNLRLRDTWASMRLLVIPIQLVGILAACYAALGRRPYEGALVVGVCFMFLFNIPANYYYVVLILVPALLLRAAAVAPSLLRRYREYTALTTFTGFWMMTLIAPRLWGDDILFNHFICIALAIFLCVWIAAWVAPLGRLRALAVAR